jgi:hypothetical protein
MDQPGVMEEEVIHGLPCGFAACLRHERHWSDVTARSSDPIGGRVCDRPDSGSAAFVPPPGRPRQVESPNRVHRVVARGLAAHYPPRQDETADDGHGLAALADTR